MANPGNVLCDLVAQLQDRKTGRVRIPGFYDDVRPIEDWERREFAALPFDEAEYAASLGVSELFGEEGYTSLERVWARPTCDVNGIYGGYAGAGAKTVLPAWAGAKVSMRLVPDQKPETIARQFEAFIREIVPAGVSVEVSSVHGADPVIVEASGPIFEAMTIALEEVWGKRPVLVREGGSIPIVAVFAEILEVPVLLAGFGLEDDNLHSPNEKFNISHFYNGIRTSVRLLDLLGATEASAK